MEPTEEQRILLIKHTLIHSKYITTRDSIENEENNKILSILNLTQVEKDFIYNKILFERYIGNESKIGYHDNDKFIKNLQDNLLSIEGIVLTYNSLINDKIEYKQKLEERIELKELIKIHFEMQNKFSTQQYRTKFYENLLHNIRIYTIYNDVNIQYLCDLIPQFKVFVGLQLLKDNNVVTK